MKNLRCAVIQIPFIKFSGDKRLPACSYSPDAYSLCSAVIRAKVLLAGNYRRAACQEELILERKASAMDRNAEEAKRIE